MTEAMRNLYILAKKLTDRQAPGRLCCSFSEVHRKNLDKRLQTQALSFRLPKERKLSLNQGTFLRNRRLTKLNLKIYQKVIPGEGSCLFHSLLDQIQSIPELQDYASSHFELHWKIVSDGYKLFLETDKLSWPEWEDEEGLCGRIKC